MADYELKDGREITFDLNAFTLGEYRAILSKDGTREMEDELIAKASGLTVDEIVNLPYLEWKRLTNAFFTVLRAPI